MSEVSIAVFTSAGVRTSFTNVGIPENALRTRLRCLAMGETSRWDIWSGERTCRSHCATQNRASHLRIVQISYFRDYMMNVTNTWFEQSIDRRQGRLNHLRKDLESELNFVVVRHMPGYLPVFSTNAINTSTSLPRCPRLRTACPNDDDERF